MSDVTRRLERVQEGDPKAAAELLPLVYDELRGLVDRSTEGGRATCYFPGLRTGRSSIAAMCSASIVVTESSLPITATTLLPTIMNSGCGTTFIERLVVIAVVVVRGTQVFLARQAATR